MILENNAKSRLTNPFQNLCHRKHDRDKCHSNINGNKKRQQTPFESSLID